MKQNCVLSSWTFKNSRAWGETGVGSIYWKSAQKTLTKEETRCPVWSACSFFCLCGFTFANFEVPWRAISVCSMVSGTIQIISCCYQMAPQTSEQCPLDLISSAEPKKTLCTGTVVHSCHWSRRHCKIAVLSRLQWPSDCFSPLGFQQQTNSIG